MINKKLVISILVFIVIGIIIFFIFHYKNLKTGNTTINKTEEQIVQDILNSTSYQAKMQVEVQTNKNTTKYVVNQEVKQQNAKQEILEPENLQGLVTQYDGKNLSIQNNKLELSKVYENYPYMVENQWWLDSFIKDYKEVEEKNIIAEENQLIIEVKKKDANKYQVNKKLYIDKKTGKPIKLIIQDINPNTLVYILYTEIEIS